MGNGYASVDGRPAPPLEASCSVQVMSYLYMLTGLPQDSLLLATQGEGQSPQEDTIPLHLVLHPPGWPLSFLLPDLL